MPDNYDFELPDWAAEDMETPGYGGAVEGDGPDPDEPDESQSEDSVDLPPGTGGPGGSGAREDINEAADDSAAGEGSGSGSQTPDDDADPGGSDPESWVEAGLPGPFGSLAPFLDAGADNVESVGQASGNFAEEISETIEQSNQQQAAMFGQAIDQINESFSQAVAAISRSVSGQPSGGPGGGGNGNEESESFPLPLVGGAALLVGAIVAAVGFEVFD